ncbi:MAG TPA: MerR family transcriptional regulator, partial [Verrucomicrobiaceae bacterium]
MSVVKAFSIVRSQEVKMAESFFTIRQLTKELGVTARTLRHYEDRKLIAPARRGQTRLYSFEDRARILIVLRGRRLGFTINEMSEMLRMYDYKDSEVRDEILTARSKFVERIRKLERKRRDIDESLLQLKG